MDSFNAPSMEQLLSHATPSAPHFFMFDAGRDSMAEMANDSLFRGVQSTYR